jgi:hypothetical protein
MINPKDVLKTIESYFSKRRTHTARILSGPKREAWFSAECFVALAQREIAEDGPLTHWGEITHQNISNRVKASPGAGELSKLPDVAVILPTEGNAAVGMIIENKVILGSEKPDGPLEKLREQMLNARKIWPEASILGLIFIAAVTHAKTPKYNDVLKEVAATTEKVFAGISGFHWIHKDKIHRIFDQVETRFAYPAMHFSLALCSIELPSALQTAVDDKPSDTGPRLEAPLQVLRSLRTRPLVQQERRSSK